MGHKSFIQRNKWAFLISAGFISEILAITFSNIAANFNDATCISPSLRTYVIVYSAFALAIIPLIIALYILIRALKQKSKKLVLASITLGLIYGALSLTALLIVAFVCWLT